MQTVPTTHPVPCDSFSPQNTGSNRPLRVFTATDGEAAKQARKAQLDIWASLSLKQNFADEAYMRDHIKAAGLRSPYRTEPATASRLRSSLKRAQITGSQINDSLGTTLSGYLKLNPLLPLWAALALVLEATGRFTPEGHSKSPAEGACCTLVCSRFSSL